MRVLSDLEQRLMRAFRLKNVRQLDRILEEPGSSNVDLNNEPPDQQLEELELEDRYRDKIKRIFDECDLSKPVQ